MSGTYRLPIVLTVYVICIVVSYPLYQYIFDSDSIGYLGVTKRLATGDYFYGINGYWSPLHSWLDIPFYKAGMNGILVFRGINALFGAGVIVMVNRLLKKVSIRGALKTVTLFICIPVIMAYLLELGVDILLCFFLLVYTDIITDKDFFENPRKNILCGIIGCVSYFAKTYAFLFFFIHFIVLQFILFINSTGTKKKSILTRNLLLGITSFLLLAAPWIYILSTRYHFFTVGYSGALAHKWTLFPAKITTSELVAVPPGSLCCFWENNIYFPATNEVFFSLSIVLKQLKEILHNFLEALKCYNDISIISIAILVSLALYLLKKKDTVLTLFLSVIIVLTAGYLPVHIETRFLWTATFLTLISGIMLADKLIGTWSPSRLITICCWCIFFGSFLIYPLNRLQDLLGTGKDNFELARELKAQGFKGRFISSSYLYNIAEEVACLTQTTYCVVTRPSYTYDELMAACRKNDISYYFFFYDDPEQARAFKSTALYKNATEMSVSYSKLILLKLKN